MANVPLGIIKVSTPIIQSPMTFSTEKNVYYQQRLSPRVFHSNRGKFPSSSKGRSMTADEYFEQVHEGHQLSKVWYPAYRQNVTNVMVGDI